MSTDLAKTMNFDEGPEAEMYGIGIALEYICGEAKMHGLNLTAYLAHQAALACWEDIERHKGIKRKRTRRSGSHISPAGPRKPEQRAQSTQKQIPDGTDQPEQ